VSWMRFGLGYPTPMKRNIKSICAASMGTPVWIECPLACASSKESGHFRCYDALGDKSGPLEDLFRHWQRVIGAHPPKKSR